MGKPDTKVRFRLIEHPQQTSQLTIALPNVPVPLINVTPKPEAIGGTVGQPDIDPLSKSLGDPTRPGDDKGQPDLATSAAQREQADLALNSVDSHAAALTQRVGYEGRGRH